MKKIYTSLKALTICMLFSASLSGQVTYVNGAASGAGDGTSWADAFTNVQDALDAATGGEIWIAAGVYTPTNTELDTFNTLRVSNEIAIYGGFAGTESTKEERIPGENTTTLSGDLMGNDMDNNFSVNKEDNVFHVMTIEAPVESTITLDELTIMGGQTRESSPDIDYNWRGGGIYSFNTLDINNCNFNNNFARSGASVYISPEINGGHGSTINNCLFEKNSTFSQAAGVFLNTLNDVTVTNCTFQNNATNRGALYPIFCQNFLFENCTFSNNTTTDAGNFGGAMFIWNSKGMIRGCTFTSNSTGNGAALYMDGREEAAPSADDIIFDNCVFSGNSAVDFGGGAIRTFMASYTVRNSRFSNNQGDNGGAIFSSGAGQVIMNYNNTYEGNTSNFGGSQACYGDFSRYTMTNNTYEGNAANTSGGALINGFGADLTVDSCNFLSNLAGFGGAIFNQNDTTTLAVYNSNFIGNSVTDGNGGAINISGPVTVTVDNSHFESNVAGFGGAINGGEGNDVDIIEGYLHISNSTILLNTVSGQGAGISLVDLDLEMTNTVIATNFNTGTGAGGGLSLNTTANRTSTFNIVNSTIVDNFSVIGSGISTFAEDETSNCIVNLQNNILSNEGLNYEVEGGAPTTSSNGGNISTDDSMDAILTGPGDVTSSGDILFVDAANSDFQLTGDSPAINIGVAAGAPDTDILGNPRVGAPDAGAYENQDPLSVEVIDNDGQLVVSPNPVQTDMIIELTNDWNGKIQLSVYDLTGNLITNRVVTKSVRAFSHKIDLSQLNSGNYILTLQSEKQKIASSFVKI